MPSNEGIGQEGGAESEVGSLLSSADPQVLLALLDHPSFGEDHLCRLLERKDLDTALLERIAARKQWQASRRVRVALVMHPHTPHRIALRFAREMYLLDLVAVSVSPVSAAEVKRFADELLLARLPQLPLGQKLSLARRASARVAGGLLACGDERVARAAIDNPRLTEAQVLRVLAGIALAPQVIAVICGDSKWSVQAAVRAAVIRHPEAPLDLALAMLPGLPRRTLEEFEDLSALRPEVRREIERLLLGTGGPERPGTEP